MKDELLSPVELIDLVLEKRYSEQLPAGVTLRRSLVSGQPRLELTNALSWADKLVGVGCFTEIIQWSKRLFIPTTDKAPEILAAVIDTLQPELRSQKPEF